jgi:hypothetical protein
MNDIARRAFMKGAGIGSLAFTVGGVEVLLTAAQARAQGVPLRVLTPDEARTLEAVGETLAVGARQAGIAHFVDQQLALPPGYALLTLRMSEVRPFVYGTLRNDAIDVAYGTVEGFARLGVPYMPHILPERSW